MPSSTHYDPFDTTNILLLPPLEDGHPAWSGFRFQAKLENNHFHIAEAQKEQLPSLELGTLRLALDDVSLESLETSSASAYDTAEDESSKQIVAGPVQAAEEFEDIWILPSVKDAPTTNKLTDWDQFLEEHHHEPPSRYLAEAGSQTFDAVLAIDSDREPPKIMPKNAYLEAMFELSLGRASQYMRWDEGYSEFVPTLENATVSGFAPETLADFRDAIASMGRSMRLLSSSRADNASIGTPEILAFKAALRSVIVGINKYMESQRDTTETLLQLQQLVQRPRELLKVLCDLNGAAQRGSSDVSLMRPICDAATDLSISYPCYTGVMNSLIDAASKPVLSRLSREIGLEGQFTESDRESDEVLPYKTLFPDDLSRVISEVRESLQLLRNYPSVTSSSFACGTKEAVSLALSFTWHDLSASQSSAEEHEVSSNSSTAKPHPTRDNDMALVPAASAEQFIATDPMAFPVLVFDGLSTALTSADSSTSVIVAECLSPRTPALNHLPVPYDQLLALSLRPIVTAQHRIFSYSALNQLYKECHFRSHLNMLWQFHLFGNGLFAARVSRALFSSDESSGEGRRRDGNTTGLRLQDRDTWPPASSELRLVLMGILSEHVPKSCTMEQQQQGDAISFSLRDLPEAELEKCRDANSIYALDFLRLHYKPPNGIIAAVVSEDCLAKYDRVFRHLLRLLRVKSVAQELIRETTRHHATPLDVLNRRFRIEIQHFATVLADYTHNVAIDQAWAAFDKAQAVIERKIREGDYEGVLSEARCLSHLRGGHEKLLDEIMRALLLKERQGKARGLLEELCGIVLRYAAASGDGARDEGAEEASKMTRRLYDSFVMGLGELKGALRGLGGIVEGLGVRLEMRG